MEAQARAEELEAGDAITPANATKIKEKRERAQALYSEAIALQTKHREGLSGFQRAKPYIVKAIVATVIIAEIISIPILLANIYMMCDKHHAPAAA